jgi:3',5'-cyclic AMP phosphodiesterase CpdA
MDPVAREKDLERRRIGQRVGEGHNDGLSTEINDNEIPVIIRDYSDKESHRVYPLGDLHIGAANHQADRWAEWVRYIEERDDTSLLLTGDLFNAAIVGAKSDVYEELHPVGDAKRMLRRQLTPLAAQGRVDAAGPGNHEARIWRAVGDCPVLDVCDSLDIPYYRAAAMVVYIVGDQTYEFYLRHGTGNGQALASLSKSGMVAQADVYVTGHVHRAAVTTDEFYVREGDRVVRRRRYYVSSGSFLGAETYALERGYVPARIGAPRIDLDGTRHDVHVSI